MKKTMFIAVFALVFGLILIGNVSGQAGSGKSAAYVKIFESGTYYMKSSITNEGMTMVMETYAKSGKMAVITTSQGMTNRAVHKDGKSYMIMDSMQMVMVMPLTDAAKAGTIKTDSMKFASSGTAVFNGKTLPYDEYSNAEGLKIRYFVDGSKLAGVRTITKEGTFDIVITELNQNVPDKVFDIPSGYQIQEIPKL